MEITIKGKNILGITFGGVKNSAKVIVENDVFKEYKETEEDRERQRFFDDFVAFFENYTCEQIIQVGLSIGEIRHQCHLDDLRSWSKERLIRGFAWRAFPEFEQNIEKVKEYFLQHLRQ